MTALLAEFPDLPALLGAIAEARRRDLVIIDAFTPMPVAAVEQALGVRDQRVNRLGFLGLALGALFGWFIQWFANVDYPLDIGGRPLLAPPSFTVLTFEFTVLAGALFLFFGMLVLNRLPRLHDPLFEAPRFRLVTNDRFFLLLDAPDQASRRRIEELRPFSLAEVQP